MAYDPENLRQSIRAFMAARGLRTAPWCRCAGVQESALRGFLAGRSRSLTIETMAKLAEAANASVAEILGTHDADGKGNLAPVARFVLEAHHVRDAAEIAESIAYFQIAYMDSPAADVEHLAATIRTAVDFKLARSGNG